MIKIAAIIVICTTSFLDCVELPFNEGIHSFDNPDKCKEFVKQAVDEEKEYRIKIGDSHSVVMGACVQWCENCGPKRPPRKR